jgi:hypothetical protein
MSRNISYILGLALLEISSLDNRFLYHPNSTKFAEAIVLTNQKYSNPAYGEIIQLLL